MQAAARGVVRLSVAILWLGIAVSIAVTAGACRAPEDSQTPVRSDPENQTSRNDVGQAAFSATAPVRTVTPRVFRRNRLGQLAPVEGPFDAAPTSDIRYEVVTPPTSGDRLSLSGCVLLRRETGLLQRAEPSTQIIGSSLMVRGNFGFVQRGFWLPGSYELRCEAEGFSVERVTFTIGGEGVALSGEGVLAHQPGTVRATGLGIFDSDDLLNDSATFSRDSAGGPEDIEVLVGAELSVDRLEQSIPYSCHALTSRGRQVARATGERRFPSTTSSKAVELDALLPRPADGWQTGTYWVECAIDGYLAAIGTFAVTP